MKASGVQYSTRALAPLFVPPIGKGTSLCNCGCAPEMKAMRGSFPESPPLLAMEEECVSQWNAIVSWIRPVLQWKEEHCTPIMCIQLWRPASLATTNNVEIDHPPGLQHTKWELRSEPQKKVCIDNPGIAWLKGLTCLLCYIGCVRRQ